MAESKKQLRSESGAARVVMSKLPPVDEWTVIWRVVIPGCGAYDHDMVLLETENEDAARDYWRSTRRGSRWPIRLERVHCGPMPSGSKPKMAMWRDSNKQNPGTSWRESAGYWET